MLHYLPKNPFKYTAIYDESTFQDNLELIEKKAVESLRLWTLHERNIISNIQDTREAIAIVELPLLTCYLWLGYDVRKLELLGISVSTNCSNLDALFFLRNILSKCDNIPLLIAMDREYFKWAISNLNLYQLDSHIQNEIKIFKY